MHEVRDIISSERTRIHLLTALKVDTNTQNEVCASQIAGFPIELEI